MDSKLQPLSRPLEVARLSSESYGSLIRALPAIAVTNDTSELQAGFQLGVQFVLQKLRDGFVVGA